MQLTVSWNKFYPAFFKELKESADTKRVEYKCLRMLLAKGPEPDDKLEISLESYGQMVKWFVVPLLLPPSPALTASRFGPLTFQGGNILTRMKGTMNNAWFFGDVERQVCEAHLAGNAGAPGTFLVRLSTTEPIEKNPFTISKVTREGSVQHQRVSSLPNGKGFYVSVKRRDGTVKNIEGSGGIEDLIAKCKEGLGLEAPLLGSKFQQIFKETKIDGYGVDNEFDDDY